MSLNAILIDIDTFVVNEVHKAEAAAQTWFKTFTPVLEADFQAFVTAMKPVALALVIGLEQAALTATGLDKFEAAVTGLVAAAGASGLTVTKTMASTLVQQVVSSIGGALATK